MGFRGAGSPFIQEGFGGADEIKDAIPTNLKPWSITYEDEALEVATKFHDKRWPPLSSHGVYIFWDCDGPLYVGESWDIGRRIHDHMCSYPLPKQLAASALRVFAAFHASVTVVECDDRKELEGHLIQRLRPRFNIASADRGMIAELWRSVNEEIISVGGSIFGGLDPAKGQLIMELLGGCWQHWQLPERCWCEAVKNGTAMSKAKAIRYDEAHLEKEARKGQRQEARKNAKKQEQGG